MNVITQLKGIGCRVDSRETTGATHKWWLTYPTGNFDLMLQRRIILSELHFEKEDANPEPPAGHEYIHAKFRLEFQTEAMDGFDGILITKIRPGRKGELYRGGIDDLAIDETLGG